MKVLLFTHEQDIDGMESVILGKYAFSNLDYVLCKTFKIDLNFKKYIDDKTYHIGYLKTPYKYRNDLNALVKENNINDVDLIGMFFPNMDVVSYRGVKDVDVSIVPTYFGGKGHKGAGTNPINSEKFKDVLKSINFE